MLLAMSSVSVSQKFILNKVSLKRNTHNKNVVNRVSPRSSGSVCYLSIHGHFIEQNHHE